MAKQELNPRTMPNNQGEGAVDSKEAASLAVKGITERNPGVIGEKTHEPGQEETQAQTRRDQQPEPSQEPEEFTEPGTEPSPEEDVQVGEVEEQEALDETLEDVDEASDVDDEIYYDLLDIGIDLGMKPSEVPEDLRPAYDEVVDTVIAQQNDVMQQRLEAQQAIMQVNEFAEKIQEKPEQLLLTMAMRNPDAFDEAVDTFQRMQQDEEYAALVRRELEAEAKMAAAQRSETAQTQAQLQRRAQSVKQRTQRISERLGVPSERAERFVADRIRANGGDITMQEVDEIVKGLAPSQKRRRSKPKTKSAEQKKKEQTANTQSVSDAGKPAGEGDTKESKQSGRFQNESNSIARTVKNVSQRYKSGQRS